MITCTAYPSYVHPEAKTFLTLPTPYYLVPISTKKTADESSHCIKSMLVSSFHPCPLEL